MSTFAVPTNRSTPTPAPGPSEPARPPIQPPAPIPRLAPPPPREDVEMDSDEEEDSDPILKRLPVYYTPHYLGSLALLQYLDRQPLPQTGHPLLPPCLRPTAIPAPRPSESKITARYKPRSQHLEITVPTERIGDRWNEDEAKEYGKGVVDLSEKVVEKKRGKKKAVAQMGDDEEEEGRIVDHLVYSSHAVPDATNYLVGVVKDGALHLNPITQNFQLRPNLTYLDNLLATSLASKSKAARDSARDADGDSSSEDDAKVVKLESKAVQVTIKQGIDLSGGGAFGKPSGGGGNGRAGADLMDPLRAKEGEAWIQLDHYHAETPQCILAFDHMFIDKDQEKNRIESVTKPLDYLKSAPVVVPKY